MDWAAAEDSAAAEAARAIEPIDCPSTRGAVARVSGAAPEAEDGAGATLEVPAEEKTSAGATAAEAAEAAEETPEAVSIPEEGRCTEEETASAAPGRKLGRLGRSRRGRRNVLPHQPRHRRHGGERALEKIHDRPVSPVSSRRRESRVHRLYSAKAARKNTRSILSRGSGPSLQP